MALKEDRLLDLAMSLSDGADVDWECAEREEGSEEERRLLAHLRLLARIAQAYRDEPDGSPAPRVPEDTRTLFAAAVADAAHRTPDPAFEDDAVLRTLGGEPPTPRGDIYGLGVLLFHLVTDAYPADSATIGELREAHEHHRLRRVRDLRPDLPEAFVRVVERALAHKTERYETAGEMESALPNGLGLGAGEGGATKGRGSLARLVRVGVPVAAGLAVLGILVWRSHLPAPAPHRDEPFTASRPETLKGVAGAASGPREAAAPQERIEDRADASAYTIAAGLYLATATGERRLESGDRVAPGNRLFLEVFDLAKALAREHERVRGAWIRQIDLENLVS